jgi:hypothetical protein
MMRWICVAAALVGCAAESPEARTGSSRPRAQLAVDDITNGMQRVRPEVERCFDRFQSSGFFSVALRIVGDGHIAYVHVNGPHVPTNDCVGHAVAAATFPPFSGAPQSVVYPFIR